MRNTPGTPLAAGGLALGWAGKESRARPETRLLVEDEAAGEPCGDAWNNRLILGDNLLALKALEREFANSVRCALIDPPYNTGSVFAQYDDGVEHSLWMSFMRDRLEHLRPLLAPDGTLWITVDDHEAHYCKVLCDEVFGRRNFVANVVWQKRTSPDARLALGAAQDHILVYARDIARLRLNPIPLSAEQARSYRNPDNDPRGPWASTDFTAQGWRPNQMYGIASPSGTVFSPPEGRCWANVEPVFQALREDNRIWFGKKGAARPRVKNFLREAAGIRAWTWWPHTETGHNQEAKKESIALFGGWAAFSTPKPERLVRRVLDIATDPGDLVIDCFAGSGTTGAVAHKMGRRWIMAENGSHALTHIVPRLRKVVRGEDGGGITQSVGWQGGGGFRTFRLEASLVELPQQRVLPTLLTPASAA